MPKLIPHIPTNDWVALRRALNKLASVKLGPGGSPTFAGLTITNAIVIGSDSIVFQPTTDFTTFFQILDADGGTPILNVDTINERVGIGTTTPNLPLHVESALNNVAKFVSTDNRASIQVSDNDTNTYLGAEAGISWIGHGPAKAATNLNILVNGNVGIGETVPETLTEWTSTTPYLTLHNSTDEDTDGGRESRLNFKGEQSGGEETTLARIEVSHDGSSNDQLGKIVLSVNTGAGLAQAFEIGSDLLATFAGSIISTNYTAANLLTACATNAGALDFSAASKTLTVEDNAVVSQDYSSDASPTFNQVLLGIDPTNVSHSVTKSYADALVAGAFWEDVDVGTVANVELSTGLETGDTIDDYVLVEGDRVLVKEQTDQTENGLYVVPASGAASRAADANTAAEIEGKKCIPLNGSLTKHRLYFCITGDITLGVTDIKFAEVTMMTAHNTLSGLQGGQVDQYYHLTSAEHTAVGALGATYQPLDTGLTNLAALGYVSDSMIKITAEDIYAIRTMAEVRTDLGLVIGTNVLAEQTIGIANNNLVEIDDADAANTDYCRLTANGIQGRNATEVKTDLGLVIGTNVLAEQTIGIADDNLLEVDGPAVSGDFARFTPNGLQGRDVTEVKTDLGLVIGTNVQAHDAELDSLAALSYVAASFVKMTGANTFALRTIGETADDLEATIDHDNLANGGAHDYSDISGNDGATDVTAAQLEELSDGSETTLHTHDYGAAFGRPIILTPQCSCGPAANFATQDTIAGGSTPAEVVSVLDFDPDASEYCDFKFALPSGYAGGGLDITIYFSMTSDHDEGTPHKVRWEIGFARIDDDGIAISADHAYDYNGISATVPSVVSEISVDHILFSDGADMNSLAASEMAILRIYRDHDHADDNATGDAELQMITIKEN